MEASNKPALERSPSKSMIPDAVGKALVRGLIFLRKRGLDSCFLIEVNSLAAALKALW
jgi:hypothetical protein